MLKGAAASGVALGLAGCLGSEGSSNGGSSDSITVPGLYDESGATSDVGRPTAFGSRDTIKYINENDLLSRTIDHPNEDYAYEVPKAQQLYKKYTSGSEPSTIIGYGTADTEALSGQVARDEIVYISASYSANLLTDETPYNFFGNLDYTSQMRAHLKWIAENDSGARIAVVYPNNPFGQAPVEGAKQYAKELGLEVGSDINLPLTANSATTQLRQAKNDNDDYLLVQATSAPMRVLLQDKQNVYPDVTVCGNTYTIDERVVAESPETFEGARYVNAFRTFQGALDNDSKGAEIIRANFKREGRNLDNPEVAQLNYIRGMVHALLAMHGLKNAIEQDLDPTQGKNARKGMFGIKNNNIEGLTEPFSYKEGDRRPTMDGRLFEVTDGSISFDTKVELPRRQEWIGL